MACDFSFDLENNFVYIRASISMDFVSSVEAMKVLLSDQRFGAHMKMLVDIRDVDYVISGREIDTLLGSPVWLSIIDGHKLAIVAGRPVQFGMANVLARKSGDTAAIQAFYSLEEGLSWLGVGQKPFNS